MSQKLQLLGYAFKAIEAGDDAQLATIFKVADGQFDLLSNVLVKYGADGDALTFTKLLEFRSFNQKSKSYLNAVQNAFVYLTAKKADIAIDPIVIDAMYQKIEKRKDIKENCLRCIFDTAAQKGLEGINLHGAQLLARGGVDYEAIAEAQEIFQRLLGTDADKKLENISALKAKLKGP